MAEQKIQVTCGFFNSVNKDRTYDAEDMTRPYKRVITEGVFATPLGTPSTDLQVLTASSGMNVVVKKGAGFIAARWFENPVDQVITVTSNSNAAPRRDSIIMRVDNRLSDRNGYIVYREGTPSSNPLPPNLDLTSGVTEYRIANIYVAAGAIYIGQDAITDLRGSSECPWITSLIKQVDTSTLLAQFNAAYSNWFEDVKDEVRRTFTLVRRYNSTYITTTTNETVIPINISQFNKSLDVLSVFINGLELDPTSGVRYTINSTGTAITLTNPLNVIGTRVGFEVFKSIDGTGADTIVSQVTDLQSKVSKIQITADDGGVKLFLTAAENVLAKFIAAGIGFHSIYAPAGAGGVPIVGAEFTGYGHLTSTRNGGIGYIVLFSNTGAMYTNYLRAGTWQGWKAVQMTAVV